MNVNSKNKNKICYICGDNVINEKSHLLKVHQVSEYQCDQCTKLFSTNQALIRHIKKHAIKKTYECAMCE